MASKEDSGPDVSDEDISPEAHKKLLDAVSQLYKKKRIEAPKRKEPADQLSEFHLSNSNEQKLVKLNDLVSVLDSRATHKDIKNKILTYKRKSTTLRKPLEKIHADRVARKLGYDEYKKQMDKWDAIVLRNRAAEQLKFPIKEKEAYVRKVSFETPFTNKTELEMKLAEILDASKLVQEDREEEEKLLPLTLNELIARRNMVKKMRARESYRIAKAVRQNKIKSKKFHRILKREKIKQELKDFEVLQKTNPEAALEKLEQLERARAEERMSLRHRNTGQWARSRAIRAKYDLEARAQLAEQLAKSRELTKKLKPSMESGSEDETDDEVLETKTPNSENPWVHKRESEIDAFIDAYNMFHESFNKSKDEIISISTNINKEVVSIPDPVEENLAEMQAEEINSVNTKIVDVSNETAALPDSFDTASLVDEGVSVEENEVENVNHPTKIQHKRKLKRKTLHQKVGQWSIEEIFEGAEKGVKESVSKKISKLKSALKDTDEPKQDREKKAKSDLTIKSKAVKTDEKLIEVANETVDQQPVENAFTLMKKALDANENEKTPQINPNKFLIVKQKKLPSAIPDLEEEGDEPNEESENDKHMDLVEAFTNDDIVDEFKRAKEQEVEKSKPKKIDLSLPGWGSWAGGGLKPKSKRKNKRLLFKFPSVPRKDDFKDKVIIREDESEELKSLKVNDLPYPFTSVADYEAHLRAPIGSTWLTQTAHKKMIEPPVITKMGAIIEPMDKSELTKKIEE